MNFDNLEVDRKYMHSQAKMAVKYSKQAEYMGNNFRAVYHEKTMKERQEIRYKQKHLKSQQEFEREQKFYDRMQMELRIQFDEIDQGYNGQGAGDGFIDF